MPPPTVRVNTFVKENEKRQADPISKIFALTEVLLGLDRLPLIGKGRFIYVFLSFIIFLTLKAALYFTLKITRFPMDFVTVTPIVQNIVISLLSYIKCKWMQGFYSELSKFDNEAGCSPRVSLAAIRNVVLAFLSCVFVILLYVVPGVIGYVDFIPYSIIPLYLVYVLEVYYFGHLLYLLIPRLKLINFYIESSLSSANSDLCSIPKEFICYKSYDPKVTQKSMTKLMNLYQIVVEAYDSLNEGIKWQLLTIIISTFVTVLALLYGFSLNTIHDGGIVNIIAIYQLGIPVILLTPLFAPCMFGDSVHGQVKKLRELLAARLYENKLDKSDRSTARALLAFSETRDLSFRLLRMLNIDISLPFKFMGLLVTYLILLLQFEKVLNPSHL